MGYISVSGITLGSFESNTKDKSVIVLTDKIGKLRVRFKAVKSASSKRSGYAYDFVFEKILLYKKQDFYTATEARLINSFNGAKSSFKKANILNYFRELLIILLPYEQPDYNVFKLFLNTLTLLNNEANENLVLCYFTFNLLSFLGYPIKLPVNKNATIFFSPEKGGFNNESGIVVNMGIVKEIEKFLSLNIIKEPKYEIKHFDEILRLLNLFVGYHADSSHLNDFLDNFEYLIRGEG